MQSAPGVRRAGFEIYILYIDKDWQDAVQLINGVLAHINGYTTRNYIFEYMKRGGYSHGRDLYQPSQGSL